MHAWLGHFAFAAQSDLLPARSAVFSTPRIQQRNATWGASPDGDAPKGAGSTRQQHAGKENAC